MCVAYNMLMALYLCIYNKVHHDFQLNIESDLKVVSDTSNNLLIQCQRVFHSVSMQSAKYTAAASNVTTQA